MKKNILLLINGFGVEKSDSYNVYSEKLMPNMDRLTKERIFLSIPNSFLDYKSAYRNFSMGINDPLTYSLIENNINSGEYRNNQLFKYIINITETNKSRLHIICFWDSDKTIEQVSEYLKILQSENISRVFLHIVLCQKSINDYKEIERWLNQVTYEIGGNVKIGVVTGENNLYNILAARDLAKVFITEFGEKWKDLSKKVEVLVQTKTAPCDTRTFSVNPTFKFEENDQVLVFNYSNYDLTIFRKELYEQKYRSLSMDSVPFYSLFPLRAEKQIPFMYNFAVSANYTLDVLKNNNIRCLILDKKENCSYINYYLTGLRNTIDDNLKYLPTDDSIYDPAKVIEIIKSYDKELYIINYEIDSAKTYEEIIDRLSKIDVVIGEVDKYIRENKMGLFITSLYGVEKDVYNQKQELLKINFSGRAPVIIDDENISLATHSVNEGSLNDLANTIFSNINNQYNVPGIIRKKSSLFSFLYKKPKGDKKK